MANRRRMVFMDVETEQPGYIARGFEIDDDMVVYLDGNRLVPVAASGAAWGFIAGTLSSQTDLQSGLDGLQNAVYNETSRAEAAEGLRAPLNSPDFTGTPTTPTLQFTGSGSGTATLTPSATADNLILDKGIIVAALTISGASGNLVAPVASGTLATEDYVDAALAGGLPALADGEIDPQDAPGIEQQLQAMSSHTVVVPLLYQSTKAEASLMSKRYHVVLKTPSKAESYLVAIDEAMEMKAKRDELKVLARK
jgi:hypothetical protein